MSRGGQSLRVLAHADAAVRRRAHFPELPADGTIPPDNPSLSPRSGAVGGETAPALPGTGKGGSIETVLRIRAGQVAQGFTPAADARGPDAWLEGKAGRYLYFAKLARGDHGRARAVRLRAMRSAYAHAAALLLAAIDRIDCLLCDNEGDEE